MVRGAYRGKGEGENLNQTSLLSTEPDAGLHPMTQDCDLSQNQELAAQLTEPPRHPCFFVLLNPLKKYMVCVVLHKNILKY